jgi:hypothetical protein
MVNFKKSGTGLAAFWRMDRPIRRIRKILPGWPSIASLLLAALLLPAPASAASATAAAPAPVGPAQVCDMVIGAAEQALEIPRQLLAAMARAESGRWIAERKASFAWPWTVTAEGEGHYYETKAQAVAAVRRLRARNVSNIDVGCLQVNLRYHPRAFRTLEAALDPMENTIYAARLLRSLYADTGSWTSAVARYHSAIPAVRARYVVKVGRLWYEEFRRAREVRKAAEPAAGTDRLIAMAGPDATGPQD